MLAEDVKAKIYVLDVNGKWVKTSGILPAGYIVDSDPRKGPNKIDE